jgi:hypothetical protein
MSDNYITSDINFLNTFDNYYRTPAQCNNSNNSGMKKYTPIKLDELSNTDIFLSKKNIQYMTYYMLSMNKKNMTKTDPYELRTLVPKIMSEWYIDKNLNEYEYVYDDILLRISFINKQFIKDCEWIYTRSNKLSMNVFRESKSITVDAYGNEETKKYSDMNAKDFANMDVWKSNQVYTYNKINRYNNKIPIWQKSMNIRHYEKESEGLHTLDPQRASLNTHSRGYNMTNYINGMESFN